MSSQNTTTTTTLHTDFIKGLSFGYAKIGMVHPLWTIKLRAQQGLPFTLNPRVLYKGLGLNVWGYPLATAIQVSVNQYLGRVLPNTESACQKLAVAFTAGMASGLVICPTDWVMTQHGLRTTSLRTTIAELAATHRLRTFFTALVMTVLREGKYGTFYLAAPAIIAEYIKPFLPHDKARELTASTSSGLLGTILTQPIDTIKSTQQTYTIGVKEAALKIYQQNHVHGFFRGAAPRSLQVTAGIVLLDQLKQNFMPEPSSP